MKSHITLPGDLFQDEVPRELHTFLRPHPEVANEMVTERHFAPVSEQHLLKGFYCDCEPELIEVGDTGSGKFGVLHRSDVQRIPIPDYLPKALE